MYYKKLQKVLHKTTDHRHYAKLQILLCWTIYRQKYVYTCTLHTSQVNHALDSGFCLRGPNLCKLCKLSQACNFNSAGSLAFSYQFTALVKVLCLRFLYPMFLFKYFKRVAISALLPDPKGQKIAVVYASWWHSSTSTSPNVTLPNILVDVVSSDNRVCNNNLIQLHTPWDHVIGNRFTSQI